MRAQKKLYKYLACVGGFYDWYPDVFDSLSIQKAHESRALDNFCDSAWQPELLVVLGTLRQLDFRKIVCQPDAVNTHTTTTATTTPDHDDHHDHEVVNVV